MAAARTGELRNYGDVREILPLKLTQSWRNKTITRPFKGRSFRPI